MKNLIKKAYMKASLLAGGALCSAGSLLAQEGGNSPQNTTLDTTSVVANAATIEKGLVTLIESIVPYIISVILAVLAAVLIYKVVRWLLRAFNTRG